MNKKPLTPQSMQKLSVKAQKKKLGQEYMQTMAERAKKGGETRWSKDK